MLSGTLEAYGHYVIASPGSDAPDVDFHSDVTKTISNDLVLLKHNGVIVDSVGGTDQSYSLNGTYVKFACVVDVYIFDLYREAALFRNRGFSVWDALRTFTCAAPITTTTATVTAQPSTTPTVTTTETISSTQTAIATVTATATERVTDKATVTAQPSTTPTVTTTETATATVTAQPSTAPPSVQDLYVTPGFHEVNGRRWITTCEPYSQTTRCTTHIWATVISSQNGQFVRTDGWSFNNLTYAASPRELWAGNPLASTGTWTASDGRAWRTECDTARTGTNGCRNYAVASVVEQTPTGYRIVTKEILNSIVRFS